MTLESRETNRGWFRPAFSILLLTVALPIAATAVVSGKSSVEKMLTNMVQPLFLAIVAGLVFGVILSRRGERGIGWMLACGACVVWILSSHLFVSALMRAWESSVPNASQPIQEPFDYLIVLGGGTNIAPDGRAQFGAAGDRAGYAARLFLNGKTRRLVTTGDTLTVTGTLAGAYQQQDDPSQQTKKIWMELGIPEDVISELAGQNTSSEMASLKNHPEYWQDKRCAILTSAFHLPRAMQLAAQAGIPATPIAADYRGGSGPLTVNQFIPEAEELMKLQYIIKEWIGMQIGR